MPDTSKSQGAPGSQQSGRPEYPRRFLGVVPRSRLMRLFWVWAVVNLLLTFLPVWDVAFNSGSLVGNFLPVTILWSYLVFSSNLVLAIVFYLRWARGWANDADWRRRFVFTGDDARSDGVGEDR
jgi:hypothetical protein